MKPKLVYVNTGGEELQHPTAGELEALSRRAFIRRSSGLLVSAAVLGELLLPRRSQAASTIVQRTISGGTQKAISMTNSTWARPITLPVNWNKIRLGFRFHLTDPGANMTGGPLFAFGFCSGTSNQYGDASTTHFVGGVVLGTATWTRYAAAGPTSGPTLETGAGNPPYAITARKRVGTTNTDGTGIGANNTALPTAAGSSAADRIIYFLDVTKGSPNYALQMPIVPGNSAGTGVTGTDVIAADFLTKMGQASPGLPSGSYAAGSSVNLAVNEGTDGTLNAINFYWNRTDATVEICDVAVAVLS